MFLSKAGRHAEALATLDDMLIDDVALALRYQYVKHAQHKNAKARHAEARATRDDMLNVSGIY